MISNRCNFRLFCRFKFVQTICKRSTLIFVYSNYENKYSLCYWILQILFSGSDWSVCRSDGSYWLTTKTVLPPGVQSLSDIWLAASVKKLFTFQYFNKILCTSVDGFNLKSFKHLFTWWNDLCHLLNPSLHDNYLSCHYETYLSWISWWQQPEARVYC